MAAVTAPVYSLVLRHDRGQRRGAQAVFFCAMVAAVVVVTAPVYDLVLRRDRGPEKRFLGGVSVCYGGSSGGCDGTNVRFRPTVRSGPEERYPSGVSLFYGGSSGGYDDTGVQFGPTER